MSILGVFFVGLVSSFAGSLAGSYIMHRVLTRPKKVPVLPKLPEAGTPYRESGKHVHSLECTIENCGEPWEEDEPLLEEQEERRELLDKLCGPDETRPPTVPRRLVFRAEVSQKSPFQPKIGMATACPMCELGAHLSLKSRCGGCRAYDKAFHFHQECSKCGSEWVRLPPESSKSEFFTHVGSDS